MDSSHRQSALVTTTSLRDISNSKGQGPPNSAVKMAWGEYPAEYNPRVHGTYDPGRWYGKADTKLSQVQLGELTSWIGRRNMTPGAVVAALSRSYWRWTHRWVHPLRPGMAGTMQLVGLTMLFFYVTNYGKYRKHRLYKYHW